MCARTCRDKMMMLDPMELESQAVVTQPMWMLRTKPESLGELLLNS